MSDFRSRSGDFSSRSFDDTSNVASPALESVLRAAGCYVHPTDDLRPQVLEAAQRACRQRRTNHRHGTLLLLVFLLASAGIPSYFLRASRREKAFPSELVHRQAAELALKSGVGTNWALYEVFDQLREEQAAQFGTRASENR